MLLKGHFSCLKRKIGQEVGKGSNWDANSDTALVPQEMIMMQTIMIRFKVVRPCLMWNIF